MAFTGKLGTSDSALGSIKLGLAPSAVLQLSAALTQPMALTGQGRAAYHLSAAVAQANPAQARNYRALEASLMQPGATSSVFLTRVFRGVPSVADIVPIAGCRATLEYGPMPFAYITYIKNERAQ